MVRDPGVEFVEAVCEENIEGVIPPAGNSKMLAETFRKEKLYNVTASSLDELVPSLEPPLEVPPGEEGNLSVAIAQLMTFLCGGVAISLVLLHPFGNTHSLVHFMRGLWFHFALSLQ